ncbi:NAD-dependent epimerase/dehydratase family protein [Methylobacterium sp. ARG-1]|uniref:NAD-dependent epimerase/dehydratase family protein n=1 Tax=Methylobacterium sp. ARG-1 TaxID=1692501 RepID=UPI00068080AD|nr:NAD-dependent epimerase/dehydratase family protein [Methylobacterium sp. ARG-1]KNY24538.1 nucleoside-diphosphate sugar epimerase [Methylobacterium sp. ARG-1]
MSKKIFVIGATGYLGGVLARHFVEEGYEVAGLARREEAGAKLAADGITPVSGSLDDGMAPVLVAASDADAVVYAAQVELDREPEVLERLCQALAGTGKTLIFTSGSGVFMKRTAGEWTSEAMAEDDAFEPVAFLSERVRTERIVRAAAETGVRAMVVRPPAIWGPGDNGQVARVYRTVATAGAACYVGSGLAAYSCVHHADLARLYALVIERGVSGALYHAAGGEFAWRWIAEAVARDLGVPTRSLSMDEAEEMFGPLGAMIYSACSRSLDPRARTELGWKPVHGDMLSQVGEPRLRALARPAPDGPDAAPSGHAFPGQ